jgi:UPF0148 protein
MVQLIWSSGVMLDEINIASKELAKGAKMLSKHCENCGFPLFERDSKEYCPNCKSEKIVSILDDKKINKEFKSHDITYKGKSEVLDKKIEYLFKKLDEETEITRINEISQAICALIKIKKYT